MTVGQIQCLTRSDPDERTLTGSGQQTIDLGSMLPAGTIDGVATVEALTGAAAPVSGWNGLQSAGVYGDATTKVGPFGGRARSVRCAACGAEPLIVPDTTAAIGPFTTGHLWRAVAPTGSTFHWSITGGVIEGSATSTEVRFTAANGPYLTMHVDQTADDCVTETELHVAVE